MATSIPDFNQATFESGQPIDNQYFPLPLGTVFSYQEKIDDLEAIVEEVTEEIGDEIAEDIVEEFGEEDDHDDDEEVVDLDDDDDDDDENELADEIEDRVEATIDELVDNVVAEFGDEVEDFDPEELAEEISDELTEDVLEELTGEEIELDEDEDVDDFGDEIVEALDDGIDELAVEIADEITEVQEELFATYDINNSSDNVEIERHEVLVTKDTKDILGVTTRVVSDREFDNDLLTDEKLAYYAQDSEGNVWLLGETVTEYEYDAAGNVIDTDNSESWIAGEGQSLPGLIMLANPTTGKTYYQGFNLDDGENQAEIVETGLSLNIDGDNFEDVIKIKEFSALEPNEFEFVYYADGVGQVLEEEIEQDELVSTSELDDVYQISDSYILDFETSAAGDELSAGTSINNQYDSLSGLTISTPRDEFGAMIFDSSNPTGDDFDLATEGQGNVLIISEDGDASDPDDLASGGTIRFEWSDSVLVDSIGLLDIDQEGGSIEAYDDDGEILRTVAIPEFGDNSLGQVEINTADVDYLDVNLASSGAIAEVTFSSLTEVESPTLV